MEVETLKLTADWPSQGSRLGYRAVVDIGVGEQMGTYVRYDSVDPYVSVVEMDTGEVYEESKLPPFAISVCRTIITFSLLNEPSIIRTGQLVQGGFLDQWLIRDIATERVYLGYETAFIDYDDDARLPHPKSAEEFPLIGFHLPDEMLPQKAGDANKGLERKMMRLGLVLRWEPDDPSRTFIKPLRFRKGIVAKRCDKYGLGYVRLSDVESYALQDHADYDLEQIVEL